MNELKPVVDREKTPPPYIPKTSPGLKKVARCYNIKALFKAEMDAKNVCEVTKVLWEDKK